MSNALVVSQVMLWVAVVVLGLVCLALLRQIGVLYERIMPVGALVVDKGPAVGAVAPAFDLRDLYQSEVRIGGISADGRSTFLFFVSPTCPVCKKLLALLPSLQASEGANYRFVLASDGPRAEHEAFYRKAGLSAFPYVLSQELGMAYQIGRLPYAVVIDGEGKVRSKGLVNNREHLESLFEANEKGMASIQEYVARRDEQHAQA
ncbi:methylamine dehydrogenase accessory protein MauD (plasmid) [Cupriavidus pinatubonensis]|uniref:methylamine dehydrogenase accessory protein MauD n=1 Tax=Cupriavidus pinatubonensis TaxID=248026 RepID=UPI001C73CCD6|nr:methylamine dehydrogenase accessory protein MauD [Cupriavidus pinatubonensis]QYY33532.1 methylamine dehydrogenase accessory protein MauD [Cupriavidus pinatubonensis]